ncbi:hypothetical protein EV360DRAFT_88293 [Lentinula raphanica]|nr:hypothetical protein EV360DRAFT_88293 [Lentinula raphanica]
MSVDKRQATGDLGELGEFFWCSSPIVNYLIAPVVPSKYLENRGRATNSRSRKMVSKLQSITTSGSVPALLALPAELLMLIAEYLRKDYIHLLCFSLTCTLLGEVTEQARYHSLCGKLKYQSWAGSRVILLGDYTYTLPENMLTEKDIKKFKCDLVRDKLGMALYYIAGGYFRKPLSPEESLIFRDERVEKNSDLRKELLDASCRDEQQPWIRRISLLNFMPVQQHGDRWILCNLSKRECVTLAKLDSVTQVIYALIGRSEEVDSPVSTMYDGEWLAQGPWARDRLDIILVPVHKQEHDNEGEWKEITADVVSKLKELADETYTYGSEELFLD